MTAEMAEDFGLVDKVIDKRPEMPPPGAVSLTDVPRWLLFLRKGAGLPQDSQCPAARART
jgi:hypothetical protein